MGSPGATTGATSAGTATTSASTGTPPGSPNDAAGGAATADATTSAPMTPLLAQAVAVGTNHACALLDDGRVACWGSRDWGQLGDGSTGPVGGQSTAPGAAVVVAGLASVTRVVIGSGSTCMADGSCALEDTTCAILGDATVQCWGIGTHGELGNGQEGKAYFEPRPVAANLSGVVDLALGPGAGCAVLHDGTVSCWGANAGRLGFASPSCGPYYGGRTDTIPPPMPAPCQATPRAVPGIGNAAHVVVAGDHQCVLNGDASVVCWTAATVAQLGLSALQIAAGDKHTCALLADGSVKCWGDNSYGQLGLGSTVSQANPTPVPGLANVKALSLAFDTSTARLASGAAMAWGDVSYVLHVSPDPRSVVSVSPVKIDWTVNDATDLQSSHFITCAVRGDRTVWCRDSLKDYQVVL
jgi:alpha-tubulin suppressor-like RCC1 family protein